MSNYSISTDHQHRMDGLTRIFNERTNAYLTDDAGTVLTFATAYEAQQHVEQMWAARHGIKI